jgi:hypothetical protein
MFQTIINFLKLPQTWTGLAALLMAFGAVGPALEFITREAGNLALFFGLLAQFLGFGAAQRLSSVVNDYANRVRAELYKKGWTQGEIEAVVNKVS